MSWTVPIQQATFKGVRFDVISVDESFEKAVAEHTYPFVNGADLEDMGLNAQVVKLQAVCFGAGYFTDYKKLLAAIQTQGAEVLVHPVRGRMPNMLLVSANLRHDAENINYVALDLTFKEATPMQPIFVFEHSLLAKIDGYLTLLDQFSAQVQAWWAQAMEVVAFGQNTQNRILSQWSAMYGCYEQLCGLFNVDKSLFTLPVGVNKTHFVKQSAGALSQIAKLFESAVKKSSLSTPLTTSIGVKSAFNAVMRELTQACDVPTLLANGKPQKITSAAQFFAKAENTQQVMGTRLATQDVKSLHCALQLLHCGVLAKAGAEIIEQQADTLTPTEIEYLCQAVRRQILATLHLVREQQAFAEQSQSQHGVYTACYQLSESLRNMAGEMMAMAVAAINQKPPLRVREVRFNSCIQQVAFDFYGDYHRSAELLRLNPHINQPNFIEQGTLLNAYTE